MSLLRETLRPKLKPQQKDHYTPTLKALDENLHQYRGKISRLMIYPFKSLGGISVDTAVLGPTGLMTHSGFRDRSAMLVEFDEQKGWKRFTQRDEAGLAQIRTELLNDNTLRLQSPHGMHHDCGVGDLFAREGQRIRAATYEDQYVEGRLEHIDGNLTAFIHEHLSALGSYTYDQLQRIGVLLPHTEVDRSVPMSHSGNAAAATEFADVGKYLLVNAATVDYVNEEIMPPAAAEVYRYNVLVSGWPANLEDIVNYATVESGQLYYGMHFGVMSTRCAVTMVDQATGIKRKDGEPLAALMKRRPRRGKKNEPTMGINIADGPEGYYKTIRVGDFIVPNSEK